MFIIDTLVAFSKLVTMLVIINMKQRLFKRCAVYLSLPVQATGKVGNFMWSGKWPSCKCGQGTSSLKVCVYRLTV